MAQSPSNEVRALAIAVMRLTEAIWRGRDRAVDPVRLALLQSAALKGPIRPSAAAADLSVHASLVTRRLQSLEDAGFITTTMDPVDRRACLIEATQAGWDELRRLEESGVEVFRKTVVDWSPDEIADAARLVGKLAESLASTHRKRQSPSGRRRRNARVPRAEGATQ